MSSSALLDSSIPASHQSGFSQLLAATAYGEPASLVFQIECVPLAGVELPPEIKLRDSERCTSNTE